ncbi:MAG: hypothetical protein V1676_00570 [Candidatus Diapherotrites archaeon]
MPGEKPVQNSESAPVAGAQGGTSAKQAKKQGLLPPQVPVYFAVLLLLLGLLGGYAVMLMLNSGKTCPDCPGSGGTPDTSRTVKVKLFYYAGCGICEERNSILDVFDGKGVDYTVEGVEAGSEKGKLLVAGFGITSAPTALVEARYISDYPEIKTAMDGLFEVKNGNYVVPEINLNNTKNYVQFYLAEPDSTCSNEPGRYEALYFSDPYNAIAITQKPLFDQELASLGDSIRLKYQFLRSNQFGSDQNMQGLVTLAGNYLLCAQQQGRFKEMNNEILAIFCNAGLDDTVLTSQELITCANFSPHFGTPLSQNELDKALSRVKDIDANTFGGCVAKDGLLPKSTQRALLYGVSSSPSAVVGCAYQTGILDIGTALCDLNSSLPGC